MFVGRTESKSGEAAAVGQAFAHILFEHGDLFELVLANLLSFAGGDRRAKAGGTGLSGVT